MSRWIILGSVCCTLLATTPASLFAQFNPDANRPNPYAAGADPRVRRAYRERAVAIIGPMARDFVETHGDEAVTAIFACSKPVAVKLVEFHACGELSKLPRPRDLLRTIAQPRHGDDVALWAMQHAGELGDRDSFDAYLQNPLEYALGLKPLEAGAAEVRARRMSQPEPTTAQWIASLSPNDKLGIAACVGVLIIVGFLLWRRRRKAGFA